MATQEDYNYNQFRDDTINDAVDNIDHSLEAACFNDREIEEVQRLLRRWQKFVNAYPIKDTGSDLV